MRIQEKLTNLLGVLISALIISGCASTATEPVEQQPAEEVVEAIEVVEVQEAAPTLAADNRTALDASGNPVSRTFYFDFDQAIVKRTGHEELDKHAKVLAGDRYLRVRLEGHADERGTREYNLALGERRANAVSAYLVAQGASRSQIEVISYGEEKPANAGHDESAWGQNRRVEIVYR